MFGFLLIVLRLYHLVPPPFFPPNHAVSDVLRPLFAAVVRNLGHPRSDIRAATVAALGALTPFLSDMMVVQYMNRVKEILAVGEGEVEVRACACFLRGGCEWAADVLLFLTFPSPALVRCDSQLQIAPFPRF